MSFSFPLRSDDPAGTGVGAPRRSGAPFRNEAMFPPLQNSELNVPGVRVSALIQEEEEVVVVGGNVQCACTGRPDVMHYVY